MNIYLIITLLIVLSASFGYINIRFLKLSETIGLMIVAILFSIGLLGINYFSPSSFGFARNFISTINFSSVLLDIMLSFLLFAGALHVDISLLKSERRSIILFSVISVILSTLLVSGFIFGISRLIGFELSYIYCLLFGGLISPTDPIAVLGILTKANVPKKIETNIVGESLFNDGVGVVIFITIMEIIRSGVDNISAIQISWLFIQEVAGGILFGIALGYLMYWLLKSIDNYQTELMITLAGVMGGYYLANFFHISGPLAIVVAGLLTGSRSKEKAMSDTTELYVIKFWELVDVIMNAILFVLIGLSIITIQFETVYMWAILLIIPAVLISRFLALRIPLLVAKKWIDIDYKTTLLMTWGGLRGGLSIAMALSLENGSNKNFIVAITYGIVVFSIIVQGLTVEKLAKKLYKK